VIGGQPGMNTLEATFYPTYSARLASVCPHVGRIGDCRTASAACCLVGNGAAAALHGRGCSCAHLHADDIRAMYVMGRDIGKRSGGREARYDPAVYRADPPYEMTVAGLVLTS
jgi:hypothetical protein